MEQDKIARCWVRLAIDSPDCDLVFLLLDKHFIQHSLKCIRAVTDLAQYQDTARSLLSQ